MIYYYMYRPSFEPEVTRYRYYIYGILIIETILDLTNTYIQFKYVYVLHTYMYMYILCRTRIMTEALEVRQSENIHVNMTLN